MKGLDFRDPVEGRKQNKEIAKSDTITDVGLKIERFRIARDRQNKKRVAKDFFLVVFGIFLRNTLVQTQIFNMGWNPRLLSKTIFPVNVGE